MVRVQVFKADLSKVPPKRREQVAPLTVAPAASHTRGTPYFILHPKATPQERQDQLERLRSQLSVRLPPAPKPAPVARASARVFSSVSHDDHDKYAKSYTYRGEESGSGTDTTSQIFEVNDEMCTLPDTRLLTTTSDVSNHLDSLEGSYLYMDDSDADDADMYDIFKGASMDNYTKKRGRRVSKLFQWTSRDSRRA